MRVAVNLTWCVPGDVGGSEQYLVRQLLGLGAVASEFVPTLFTVPGFASAHPALAERFEMVELPVSGTSRSTRVAAEHTWLWRHTRRFPLVHHGGGTVPGVGGHPILLTVHDLQFLEYPQYFSRLKLEYLRRRMPSAVRRADLIAVPSQFVRATIVEAYGVEPARIVVVPHGVEQELGSEPTGEGELRARFGLGEGRVLVLPAATFPHKGHRFLLELLARHWTDPELRVVFVGGRGLAEDAIAARAAELGVADRVVRTGRVSTEDRDGLVRMAFALVFPTEYEGFGAPLIEAMALGTPIIASDRAAVPEVLGAAGLSLPLDVDAWADALDTVERRRSELTSAGAVRRREFTNIKSGIALASAYRRALV